MSFCYSIFKNYGIAIILFTLISKIILLPISIWVQKNSIKMVKMQPDISRIKINYFGDKDKIADETSKLYKKEKYNAFVSLIPLFIQIVLLVGLVEVINKPLTYILDVPSEEIISLQESLLESDKTISPESSSIELMIVKDIKKKNIEKYDKITTSTIQKVEKLDLNFMGFDMSWVAEKELGVAILIPIIAALSALIMCVAQNRMNVLQQEQSNLNKWGMVFLSVGLSLYLGFFVPAGVALYWTFSNLFAIVLQWLLNIWINPKKYVNYEELEKAEKELKELSNLDKTNKRTKEQIKKEKDDYKKFFKIANKHLVFYSESNGFYKYFKGIIEYLLKHTNITIHYITSDYNDKIFELEKENNQIKAYYIEEKKLITLMMKMDADVVVMTMPDLDSYHIKRSYIRKDIKYVFIPHGIDSINLTQRYKSINAYDVFFACGKYQRLEAEKTYELFGLNRKIYDWGYSLLDDMIAEYESTKKEEKRKIKSILIAPSWQKDNICDLCLNELLDNLKKKNNYEITVRPHPQEVRHMREKFELLKEKYKKNKNIIIQTDFSKTNTIFNADILITDWSSIGYEYAYTTKKPVIFIDTPIKIMNPNYKDINVEPINIWSRNIIGKSLKTTELKKINETVDYLLTNGDKYEKDINNLLEDSIYNLGNSSQKGAEYIIELIQNQINERNKQNEKNK
ncbi:MAG: membrane protein insertase YidC [Tenericutes bacterium]|nr:membrane protein insertase YidC [Mycoplasmatota bacterium]